MPASAPTAARASVHRKHVPIRQYNVPHRKEAFTGFVGAVPEAMRERKKAPA
jgi:hypothetical protein